MQNQEQTKTVILVPPQLKDNGAPASLTYLDTKGWSRLRVMIVTGVMDAATSAAPLLQDCDTTDGTFAAITDAALADAISATEDSKLFAIDVDMTNGSVKRYVKCLVTAGDGTTGTNLCVLGILAKPTFDDHDGLATDAGLTELITV